MVASYTSIIQVWCNTPKFRFGIGIKIIINTRDPSVAQQQVVQDLQSYINYLKSEPDESWRLPDLIKYLKRLESNRGNSVIPYLPEYEDLFRSAGY
jgi:hypothetical protein